MWNGVANRLDNNVQREGQGPASADSSIPSIAVLPPHGQKRPHSDDGVKENEAPAAKRQSKWSAEENALIVRLRGEGMKWDDISSRLPGRSPISCRLHYQNFLERRAEWTDEQKNRLARLYDRFKKDMWKDIAKELEMPWRAVEAMHWDLGAQGIANRTGVAPFHVSNPEYSDPAPPAFATQAHHPAQAIVGYPHPYNPGYNSSLPPYAPAPTSTPAYPYSGAPMNHLPAYHGPPPLPMSQMPPMIMPRQRSRSTAPTSRNRTASRGRRRTDSTSQMQQPQQQQQPQPQSIRRGSMQPLAPAQSSAPLSTGPLRSASETASLNEHQARPQLPPFSSIHAFDGRQYPPPLPPPPPLHMGVPPPPQQSHRGAYANASAEQQYGRRYSPHTNGPPSSGLNSTGEFGQQHQDQHQHQPPSQQQPPPHYSRPPSDRLKSGDSNGGSSGGGDVDSLRSGGEREKCSDHNAGGSRQSEDRASSS